MHDPNDDTDVTSGTTDGAQMETTPAPAVPKLHVTTGAVGERTALCGRSYS